MANLSELRIFIADFMEKLEFPADAKETFINCFDTIASNEVAGAWFSSLLAQYDKSVDCDYTQMLDHAKNLSEAINIHEYTVAMVLLLCLSKKMLERYLENGMSEELWLHTMRDLRYKLFECRSVHKVNGNFVGWWYPGFYKIRRLAFGRLQFEIVFTSQDFTIGDTVIPAGSKVLNMHIPTTGTRLDHNEVLESYRLAAKWFESEFEGKPIVFHCNSWLLSPWHKEVLSPTSNLVEFYNDFKIVDSFKYSNYNHLWLLFGCSITTDTSTLPKDSSLRRAYIDLIERGEPCYSGKGLFIYKDGEIIND